MAVQEGKDLPPRCDLCGMHMPEVWLIKHQSTQRCDRNTPMQWRRRDVAIASQYVESSFSLTWDDEAECIEEVDTFKCMVRMLDWSYDDWTAVLRNFGKACRLWSQLGKLLRRKGADPQVSAIFYQAVVHDVLLFGADIWVLS